ASLVVPIVGCYAGMPCTCSATRHDAVAHDTSRDPARPCSYPGAYYRRLVDGFQGDYGRSYGTNDDAVRLDACSRRLDEVGYRPSLGGYRYGCLPHHDALASYRRILPDDLERPGSGG